MQFFFYIISYLDNGVLCVLAQLIKSKKQLQKTKSSSTITMDTTGCGIEMAMRCLSYELHIL